MKTKIKKLPQCRVEIDIEVPAQDFDDFFEKAIGKLGREVSSPGFRKGKLPRDIVLREVGSENILMEAAKLAIEDSYRKVISDSKMEPISQPKIEILKLASKNPFGFRAVFSVLPLIELPDYRVMASQTKKGKVSVQSKEVDDACTWLQKSRAKLETIESQAKKDNFVEIEFSSPEIEQGKIQKDGFILGKGHLIPGFEEKIEGMRAGEQKEFSVSVSASHFRKDIAGKKIEINMKLNAVKKVELPEINDQFAGEMGDFKNLNALKKNIEEGLMFEKELLEIQRVQEEILSEIEKACQFEIPLILVEIEKERMLSELRQRVEKNLNLSWQEYLEKIHPVKSDKVGAKQFNGVNKSEKEMLDSFEQEAQKRVKRFLIIREISKKENVEVTEDEVKEEVNNILKRYPGIETVRKNIDLDKLRDYTKERIMVEKTLMRLKSFMSK